MTDKEIAHKKLKEFCYGKYCRGNNIKPIFSEFYSSDFSEGYYGTHSLKFSSGGYVKSRSFLEENSLVKIVLPSILKSK